MFHTEVKPHHPSQIGPWDGIRGSRFDDLDLSLQVTRRSSPDVFQPNCRCFAAKAASDVLPRNVHWRCLSHQFANQVCFESRFLALKRFFPDNQPAADERAKGEAAIVGR